jgi:outer membrane protein TolC
MSISSSPRERERLKQRAVAKSREEIDASRAAAAEQLEAAHREVANLEAEVTLEIHHWVTRIESARIRAELAEETLLPRIRTALESATAALSAGLGELRDTLDLRRQWLDAQSSQATAIAEQWSAIAELLLLCGWHDLPQSPSPLSRPSPAP